jgi:NADH:ubiquinone oxidoreductase subunit F (NADH-binding)
MEKPTVINNVETLMNIPPIIRNGADWFADSEQKKAKAAKYSQCAVTWRNQEYMNWSLAAAERAGGGPCSG